jgi:hypothetical protein
MYQEDVVSRSRAAGPDRESTWTRPLHDFGLQ